MLHPLVYTVATPLISIVGFASFILGLGTTLLYVSFIGLFSYLAVRRYEKHTHPEYDDRLTDERIENAIQEVIRQWKNKK